MSDTSDLGTFAGDDLSRQSGGIDNAGFCERGHCCELPVRPDVSRGRRCRPPTWAIVTPVNPYRRQSHRLGWFMVVEQTLRHMQKPAFTGPRCSRARQQRAEITQRWFVSAYIFRRENHVEVDAKAFLTSLEGHAIDVRQDDEAVAIDQSY